MVDFSELIMADRQGRKRKKFKGTFLEYLELLKEDTSSYELAHERLYRLLTQPGVDYIKTEEDARLMRLYGKEVIKRYHFFKDDFFGIDQTIMKLVRYFCSAAMRGEESRQVLYLVGPVGAGKSSLIEAIKRLLETSAPIYALDGCPMREEPLHLIPKHLRPEIEKLLGIKIEGDLCPVCKYRLMNEFGGKYEDFPVV